MNGLRMRLGVIWTQRWVLCLGIAIGAQANSLPGLPAGTVISGIAIDADGNLLVAGRVTPPDKDFTATDAFVSKYSPDGLKQLYYLKFAGNLWDAATDIAVDNGGNAYVVGNTASADFPTTPGALQPGLNGATQAGFVVKLNPVGSVVYNTLFYNGTGQNTSAHGVAVNAIGEVFVTGQSVGNNFFTTPGAPQPKNSFNTFYVMRLSAKGDSVLYSAGGLGGTAIAVDAQNNAYVAGDTLASNGSEVPITPGAFQSQLADSVCASNRAFVFPCDHQYAAKLDPSGKLVFCTFISGTYQDIPARILADANGDVYLAGTTGSRDYPTTSGALQTKNLVVLPPDAFPPSGPFFGFTATLPSTGYVTKLSGDGTHLIYSTLLGGSQVDSVSGIGLDSAGRVYVATRAQSPDFPGLPGLPRRCLPDRLHDLGVVTVLDAAGARITAESVVEGTAPGGTVMLLAMNPRGGVDVVMDPQYLAAIPVVGASPADAIGCITDQADYAQATTVAPGQWLNIFGSGLANSAVLVNGVAATATYASNDQINFVMPYEVAGQATATVQVGSASRTLPVAAANPSLITDGVTDYPLCAGNTVQGSVAATVLNEDGTKNSCANPAAPLSRVAVILNGTGAGTPTLQDANLNVERVAPVSWAPGIWEADLRLSPVGSGFSTIHLTVNGVKAREQNVPVWVGK